MKENYTLLCQQPGQLAYVHSEMPDLKPGYTLLKIRRIGICGTDLHAYQGTQPYFSYPRILGHELAAEVMADDGTGQTSTGRLVTIMPYQNCGECLACRSGKTNCCSSMQVFGVHQDGGMRQYLQVPERLVIDGQGLSLDELALVEPLAIGAHGIRRAGIKPGEYVLVIGAGPIGLGTMEFARIAGAKVIALDINAMRLEFCRERLGVDYMINSAKEDALSRLTEITNGNMPQVVIDATGNLRAINEAFRYIGHGGRYVLIGLQKGEITFSHPEFHKREATLMSSRNATIEDFGQVISAMKSNLINPANYITHRTDFDQAAAQFHSWLDPEQGVIKAMINL